MGRSLIRCAVVSLGCPKNLVDSERMLGWLAERGFALTPDVESAEVIIVNTCGFLQAAVNESLAHLRRLARLKRTGNCRMLIAAGCLVSRFPELVRRRVPEVDACLGVLELDRIAEVVAQKLGVRLRRQAVLAEPPYAPRIVSTPHWYAYLKIAEGCDRTCTFCAIPAIRGRQRSRPMDELEAEAHALVEQGVRELILIAQDTTRYGVDLYGKPMLPELVRRLAHLDGIKWLRLLYCYPTAVSDRLIAAMAESESVARYIDIPLQHSHPDILRAMQRGGDAEFYARLIERLRAAMPDIAIRTTFIVGFPGETERHFEHLSEFVRAMRFDRLGVFVFSPESGTPAAQMPHQVPREIAEERRSRLLTLQQEIARQRNERFVGRELEVVLERFDRRHHRYEARSQYEAPEIDGTVFVASRAPRDGQLGAFVRVTVVKADIYDLHAVLAETAGERGQANGRRFERVAGSGV
ncbi:Ribosomal protein S12 methylthiotransferase RimO [bacterium HR17]|jgi:ribosomal protein S12 methylthiotransferase|uniref:Ribosomal protein uS12 methylthiotransferase RimO n=1 Tax=Candidatus Fervidibacter japonicus TaxID=2035412 RepID=A0A2H5XBX7_9BACT|nr:Ribosomal protein S12 methylthiotransferase RimO [bacterium HR17]